MSILSERKEIMEEACRTAKALSEAEKLYDAMSAEQKAEITVGMRSAGSYLLENIERYRAELGNYHQKLGLPMA